MVTDGLFRNLKRRKQMRKRDIRTDNVTYLLTMKDGTLKKVTVPPTWKVTFGPIVPGAKSGGYTGTEGLALRFYEGEEKQRAVFTGVVDFRDMSIQIEERVTKTQQETFTKETPQGARNVVVEGHIHEWVNPDKPVSTPQEFLRLPEGTKK